MSKLIKTLALSAFVTVAGCATVMSGSTQTVQIQAVDATSHEPLSGVSCTVTDGKGNIYVPNGMPGAILVTKGNGALQPTCKRAGYRQTSVGVGSSFNAWTLVNVVFFWPGLIVDAATGAMQSYPSHMTVLMAKG